LEKLIEEASEAFLATDVKAVRAQTHAALCAARNVLSYEQGSGMRHGWLPKIEAFYRLYRSEAMTETEANWNWFGRPTWTEPCAIVDSFLLALDLWRVTGNPEYLNDAHRIFYNGLGYGQKPHGGFGCDSCAGMDGLQMTNRHWDVPGCCNMRGAVGLSGAAAARVETRGNTLLLPFYADGRFQAGGWSVTEQTGWPLQGEVTLQFRHEATNPPAAGRIGFFVPVEASRASVKVFLNGQETAGEWRDGFLTAVLPQSEAFQLRLQMDLPLRAEAPHNPSTRKDVVTLRYGFLVLGTPEGGMLPPIRLEDLQPLGGGRYSVPDAGLVLEPLCQMPFKPSTQARSWREQVLFQLKAQPGNGP
jgi:hypothetical protein